MASAQEAPAGPSDDAAAGEVDESSLGWKIFTAFVSDAQIEASEEELVDYVVETLNLDKDKPNLPQEVVDILPLVVVAYMNLWSGWHFKNEFLAGKFKKEHYFNRFKKFMSHKLRVLLNNFERNGMKAFDDNSDYRYKCAVKSTGKPSSSGSVAITQAPTPGEFSPFAISIKCPAHMLNNIVFSNSGDDVIMKQHLGNPWQDLNTTQLVNWPHIEVTFRTDELCFVRKQASEFVRYLNFLPHECKKISPNIIEHAEVLPNARTERQCYTYRLIEAYIKEYLQALKTILFIPDSKFDEIQTVLYQFLEDIRYINVNKSMVTKTLVLFRLSRVPFIRNKKLVKNRDSGADEARVGYCEIITPKIELMMLYFSAKQKNTPDISFEVTDKIRHMHASDVDANNILPLISYKCTFCNIDFKTSNAKEHILDHLRKEHKMEQHVRCTLCKKQFDVLNLAACRWRHRCLPTGNAPLKSMTIVE